MKILLVSLLIASVPGFAAASDSGEGELAALTVESPVISAPTSVDLRAVVEFQAGYRYAPGQEVGITVNEGETSVLTVEYKREIFASEYRITGTPAVDRNGLAAWSLHVVRQDREGSREMGPPKVADLMLNPGERISLLSRGQYRGMARNLRLTLSY